MKTFWILVLSIALFWSCSTPEVDSDAVEVLDSHEDFVKYRKGDTIFVHVLTLDYYHTINTRTHEQTIIAAPVLKDESKGSLHLDLPQRKNTREESE